MYWLQVKALGTTRNVPSEDLESNEPIVARQQKRYCLEPLTESISVLDIGMSELLDSGVNENSETARTPLSGSHFYDEPQHADSIDGPRWIHLCCGSLDIRGVARKCGEAVRGNSN